MRPSRDHLRSTVREHLGERDALSGLLLDPDSPGLVLQEEEVSGAVWLPQDEVRSPTLRAKLLDAGHRPVKTVTATVPPGTEPHIVGVHLVLEQDGRVLLGRRHPDSAYAGGMWHVLAGHCEYEAATACLVREAHEEAGLVLGADDLTLVHTVQAVDRPGAPPRIQLFFHARAWEGTPELREPDKTVAWQYWDIDDLPDAIVPYTRTAIEGIRAGRPYTEMGWSR
ncbi:NUDIX hydrolase [Streptomyces vietnamensis]|uniref:NUDIX hydrolase n=1 Tax=Streptomyces vietnamensis TaxID=362257 RepID=UPI0034416F50